MPRLPLACLLFLLTALRPAWAQDSAHVVIVATSDVHGHLMAWDYVQDRDAPWGLVRAAHVVDSLRTAYPGAVVLLDGGDLIQGNPFATYFATVRPRQVHPVIDALNAMRYDAVVLGDHDFDFGLDVLDGALSQAAFPVLGANVFRPDRDTAAFTPHVVFSRGGIRVGVTGLTSPGPIVWNAGQLEGRLRIRPVAEVAQEAVERVRAAGADLVIALVHAGLDGGSSYDTMGVGAEHDAAALARLAQRPDLVIVGHSHGRMRDSVIQGAHFVQPQPWARSASVIHAWLVRDARGARVVRLRAEEIPLGDVPPDPVLAARLRDAHDEARYWAGQPLGTAEGTWSSREARVRDTPLMDVVAGAMMQRSGAQLAALAAHTTTVGFGPGPVRIRDVAGLYPDEGTLRAVRIDGGTLREVLEHAARYFRAWVPGGPLVSDSVQGADFVIVAGASYGIDLTQPVGSRIRDLSRDGRAVTPADTFTLALSSLRQAGSGGYGMLRGLPVAYDRREPIRTVIEDAIRAAETLQAADHFAPSWRLLPPAAEAAALAMFAPLRPPRDTVIARVVVSGALRGAFDPQMLNGRAVGGLAALAARVDSLEAACGCPTFWVDGGGASYGAPVPALARGALTTAAFETAGVDAATLGVGDLAVMGETLSERLATSHVAWVAVNAAAADPATPLRPWVRLDMGGRSVAVMGVVDGTPPGASERTVAGVRVRDPAAAIASALPALRAASPDAVIVIGDFDAACTTPGCGGEAVGLARALDSGAVHAVVGGTAAMNVRGTTVAPVLAYGVGLTVVDVVQLADGGTAARARVDTVWADRVTPDAEVAAVVTREMEALSRALDEPVATLRFALGGEARDEGDLPLGRLAADAVRGAGRGQIGLVPSVAVRLGLPGGTVRLRHLYERLPFPSPLVALAVSGEELLAALDAALAARPVAVQVSGLTVRYDATRRAGQRVRDARLDGGARVERRARYRVVVPQSLFELAGFSAWAARSTEPLNVTDRQALRRYLGLLRQPVEAPAPERVTVVR
jgi:2',3'-cyclic-nucleotide 2'-phosphodiesterase/3'-nucleotidase